MGSMETRKTTKPYPSELRERAVRLVREQAAEHGSQWSAIRSIAEEVGCNAETLRLWVRRAERDRGARPGPTTDERDRLKALDRENLELLQANEILRKASAYFAQAELDRRFKPWSPSSTSTASCTGSSRSAAFCRSPRRRITPTPPGAPIRASFRPGPSAISF